MAHHTGLANLTSVTSNFVASNNPLLPSCQVDVIAAQTSPVSTVNTGNAMLDAGCVP